MPREVVERPWYEQDHCAINVPLARVMRGPTMVTADHQNGQVSPPSSRNRSASQVIVRVRFSSLALLFSVWRGQSCGLCRNSLYGFRSARSAAQKPGRRMAQSGG